MVELKHEMKRAALDNGGGGNELVQMLDDLVANVRSVDDLYLFFDKTFTELRQTLSNLQFGGATHPV